MKDLFKIFTDDCNFFSFLKDFHYFLMFDGTLDSPMVYHARARKADDIQLLSFDLVLDNMGDNIP